MIQVGDRLPAANLKRLTADGIKDVPIAAITQGKKVVLFAVPGAFTPTCSEKHLPGFLSRRRHSRPRASTRSRASRSTTRS